MTFTGGSTNRVASSPSPTATGEQIAGSETSAVARKTLTRSALITQISARATGLTEDDVRFTVSLLLTAITEHVARGGRVEIRGFGSFVRRPRRARISRNPGTGAQVFVDAKFVPHFKMSGEFRRGLNASLAADARSVGAAPTSPPHQGRQENANALTRVSA